MRDAYFAEADVKLGQLRGLDDAPRRAKLVEWNGAELDLDGIGSLELDDLARPLRPLRRTDPPSTTGRARR